ncbi:MAG: hypothetical protein QXE86_02325 [Archaeoglobaceae archaeon]
MRYLVLLLLVSIALSGCIAENADIKAKAVESKVYNCQCHEEPWKYVPHYETSCKDCHGNEIVVSHLNVSGWVWSNLTAVNCEDCHEKSLLSNHMPSGCELCHTTMVERHSKYLEKYIWHEVRS